MPVHLRVAGDVVVLSNFGRLMDDPRHFDAADDVRAMLGRGYRKFVLELRGVGTLGASGLGLLMTITREVRRAGGEAVLAQPSRGMVRLIGEMQLDEFWDSFESVDDALESLGRTPP